MDFFKRERPADGKTITLGAIKKSKSKQQNNRRRSKARTLSQLLRS